MILLSPTCINARLQASAERLFRELLDAEQENTLSKKLKLQLGYTWLCVVHICHATCTCCENLMFVALFSWRLSSQS